MADTQALHQHLLRPSIIQILRGNGFASARPSVLDTLTDLAARYIQLVASRTASHVFDRTIAAVDDDCYADQDAVMIAQHNMIPSITDVRLGLADAAFFTPTMTASEEAWAEVLRKPLKDYSEGARGKEERRRDGEDTRDVREFVDWATGPVARETRRVAGLLLDKPATHDSAAKTAAVVSSSALHANGGSGDPSGQEPLPEKQDYLTILKKKKGKYSDESRYAGTVLGKELDVGRIHRIEGGPHTVSDWKKELKRKHEEIAT